MQIRKLCHLEKDATVKYNSLLKFFEYFSPFVLIGLSPAGHTHGISL